MRQHDGSSAALAIAMFIVAPPLGAQRQRPLSPLPPDGLRVAPFFDGWYANPDGTITFSFGYSNLNREEVVEIPLGPDNFIEPKEYDGRQPTSFPPGAPDSTDGGGARSRRPSRAGARRVYRHRASRLSRQRRLDACVTADRPSACRQARRPEPTSSAGRWPWDRCHRFSVSSPTARPAAAPRASRPIPCRPRLARRSPLAVWINDDSVREKDPVPIKPRASEAGDERDLVQALRSGPRRLQPAERADRTD